MKTNKNRYLLYTDINNKQQSIEVKGDNLNECLIKKQKNKIKTIDFIPSTIITLRKYLFSDCINLIHVEIPENILYIEKNVFENCSSLEEIYIPKNIKFMEDDIFSGCINLKNIIIKSVLPPLINANTFNGMNVNCRVCVLKGNLNNYLNKPFWKNIFIK